MLEGVGSSHLKVMLDTGHLNVTARKLGVDLIDYLSDNITALGSKLCHIHISDNAGALDSHLLPGEGSFDFNRAIDPRSKTDYDGFLSAEIMIFGQNPVPPTPARLLAQTKEYLNKAAERINRP
jgi:protein FrlC